MKRSDALFKSCCECGSDRPNHSGVCGQCERDHGYAERPFVDDVQPSDRTPAPKDIAL